MCSVRSPGLHDNYTVKFLTLSHSGYPRLHATTIILGLNKHIQYKHRNNWKYNTYNTSASNIRGGGAVVLEHVHI